jgi:hypothetical protein
MLTADAASTQIGTLRFPVDHESGRLNIGQPAAPGMLLGMAHPMAEMYCFTTPITFCSQIAGSFSQLILTTGVKLYHNFRIIQRRGNEAN